MDIDSLVAEFGSGTTKSKPSSTGLDIDSLVSEFGGVEPKAVPKNIPRVIIDTTPKPPISGISKESSDELNQTRLENKGGANPRRMLPTTSIQESAYEADVAGKEMLSSGVADISSGHPYKGIGKIGLGAFQRATSPITGIVEGAIGTPISDITGSKEIGSKAALVAGSAIPIVPGGAAVVKALPKNKSLSTLVENIGQENLPAVVSAMKANPRLAPADLSPRVLQDTQHLFTQDGPQINYLAETSAKRMGGAKEAVELAYDTATGLPVNAVDKLKELKTLATDVGSKEINPAITGAKPVDVTPVLTHIDDVLKPGVNKVISSETTLPSTEINKQLAQVRAMLANAKEQRTDPKSLHEFQSVLRQTADGLLNSSDGHARRMGHALMKVRNELVNAIDTAAEGKYKPALSNYRDAKQIDDAFHHGYDGIFTNSKKLEGRPEFTNEWFKGLSEAEKEAAREGARLQLDTQINNFRFAARKGMEIPEVDFNRQKMELLFGKEKTDTLITSLKHERAIANTHNKIIEGSQTAMRSASKSQFALPTKTEVMQSAPAIAAAEASNYFMGGVPAMGAAILGGAKAGATVKDIIKLKLAKEHNAQYAKYALPTEGPDRDALIKALEARITGPKQSLLTRGTNTLSRLVAP